MTRTNEYPASTTEVIDALMKGAASAITLDSLYIATFEADIFGIFAPWLEDNEEAHAAFDLDLFKSAFADTRWQIL